MHRCSECTDASGLTETIWKPSGKRKRKENKEETEKTEKNRKEQKKTNKTRNPFCIADAGRIPGFHFTGNFVEFSSKVKSPPGRIALRRRGIMSLERPAAGGESCRSRILSWMKIFINRGSQIAEIKPILKVLSSCDSTQESEVHTHRTRQADLQCRRRCSQESVTARWLRQDA